MLQQYEKDEDLSQAPLTTSSEDDTKKNASPEVEVISQTLETIEISPEAS